MAMVVVQLAVVGAVLGGARDQDLSVLRVEGARAFYAAEAGANMAVREWITQIDADGDGGIGTISNDGNENTDPSVGPGGNARFNVTIQNSGSNRLLIVRARCGSATRQIEILVTP